MYDKAEDSENVISGAEQVTAEWLTGVLRRHDPVQPVTVGAVRIVLQKRLPYSTIIRLSAKYDDPPANLPHDFVLKLAPGKITDPTTVDVGRAEVEFYQSVAPGLPCPPLIECFDTGYSADSGRSHILMRDLSDTHSQPEQNQAPSPEMSRLAVEALARVHAAWWNSPELGNSIGKLFDEAALASFIDNLESSVTDFIDRSGVLLTREQLDAYDLMLKNAEQIWGRLMHREGLTVTHGDCHWWNYLYPRDPQTDAVHIFDWHLWHVDLGARDLAFLLALGGFAEPRPDLENGLLRAYRNKLSECGVSDYGWEQLLEDYRWSAIRNMNLPVIFWTQGKHESTVRSALERAFASYQRLQCEDLIA